MSHPQRSRAATAALVAGSVTFGLVLASGFDLPGTARAANQPEPAPAAAVITGLPSFADLAERVSPAVVSIRAVAFKEGANQNRQDPFEFFFGPQPRQRGQGDQADPQERRAVSGGSGFLVSADGYVVTNNHVVDGADQLEVHVGDEHYPATVKGLDPATDLALLKIEAEGPLPFLALGNSDTMRPGDWVMAIGSPLNLESSVTVGVISAKGRSLNLTDRALEDFIQTDAAINFGNSGGPLINLSGEVIGINTAINYGADNIGFAVPSNTLRGILDQLRDDGKVRRGYLGVSIDDLDRDSAQAFGLDSTDGALVTLVEPDTPAGKAGVRHGDIVVEVAGQPVRTAKDLINIVSRRPPGDKVELVVLRDGKRLEKTVELGERPGNGNEAAATEDEGEDSGIDWLGLRYQAIDPALRRVHGIPEDAEGVWVASVDARSPLVEKGVRPGDLIVEVNGVAVATPAAFEKVVKAAESGSVVRLYLQRFDPRSGASQRFFAFVRTP